MDIYSINLTNQKYIKNNKYALQYFNYFILEQINIPKGKFKFSKHIGHY